MMACDISLSLNLLSIPVILSWNKLQTIILGWCHTEGIVIINLPEDPDPGILQCFPTCCLSCNVNVVLIVPEIMAASA